MMKTRIFFATIMGLLILGMFLVTYVKRDQEPVQNYPATVNLDCAPWDGTAFTLRIPVQGGDSIDISIWQAPEIRFPINFSFPDDTGHIGNALQRSASDEFEILSGKVYFSRVNTENPIEGKFELKNESGEQFKGKFTAKWENKVAMCG